MAGEQRVLELRQHRVLVADDAVDERLARREPRAPRCARTSSLTGRDTQPLAAKLSEGCRDGVMRAARVSVRTFDPTAPRTPRGSWSAHAAVTTASSLDLSGTWRARDRRRRPRASAFADPAFDDADWPRCRVPAPLAHRTPRSPTADGPVLYRRRFDVARRPTGRRRVPRARRRLLLRRRLARRRLPRRDRGLLLPAHVRGHRRAAAPTTSTCSRSRSRARRQTDRTAKRIVTGVFSHWDNLDPDVEPGRAVATGAPASRPARCASRGCACCAPRRPRSAAGCVLDLTLDAGAEPPTRRRSRRGLRARVDRPGRRRRARRARRATSRSPPARTTSSWTLDVDHPPRWWPRRSATQPRCDARGRRRGRRRAERRRAAAHRVPRDPHATTGSSRSTASACSSMGSNQGPTRMALGEATPDELRARRRSSRVDANLDLLRVARARHPARAVRRRRRRRAARLAGLPAAVGLRARRPQAGGAPGARRWSTCSATTRASCCGARTTSRSRSTSQPGEPLTARPDGEARRRRCCCRRGTRTCSTARSPAPCTRPTRPARSTRTPACSPASAAAAPTPTSTSAGTTASSTASRRALRAVPRLGRFVTEFGAQAVPETRRLHGARALARPRLGPAVRAPRVPDAMFFDAHVPPGRLRRRSTSGAPRPRRTRPRSSSSRSRTCAG